MASPCSTTRRAGPTSGPSSSVSTSTGPCSDSGVETQGGGCSELLPVGPGTNTWVFLGHRETAGNDEVHGERGDDTVYVGGGSDVVYGDSGDDDIVGGWGNDWISGGTGQDGILGDDGRIFTSRNSDRGYTVGTNTTGTANLRVEGDELHRCGQRELLQRAAVRHHGLPAGRHVPVQPLRAVR